LAACAGEEAVVTDAVEALWKNVEQKAADELVGAAARPHTAARVPSVDTISFQPPVGGM
jgi:hypothetical protein